MSEVCEKFKLEVGPHSFSMGVNKFQRFGRVNRLVQLLQEHASLVHFIRTGVELFKHIEVSFNCNKDKENFIATILKFSPNKKDAWINDLMDMALIFEYNVEKKVAYKPKPSTFTRLKNIGRKSKAEAMDAQKLLARIKEGHILHGFPRYTTTTKITSFNIYHEDSLIDIFKFD